MIRTPAAHIAGIGTSIETPVTAVNDLAISAGTKALLDAGVTYSSVDQSVACFLDNQLHIPRSCFNTFGMTGTPVAEIDNVSGLNTAVNFIRSGQCNCVLAIGIDREASKTDKTQPVAVAFVVVSTLFLTSHAYLKDQAVCVRACNSTNRIYSRMSNGRNDARTAKTAIQTTLRIAQLETKDLQIVEVEQAAKSLPREALGGLEIEPPTSPRSSPALLAGSTGWGGLCGLIYQLRGWAGDAPVAQARNCLQYTTSNEGHASVVILSRSDGRPAPARDHVENVRDGRERLGYNPAAESRAITIEDLQAVRANEEFTSDDTLLRLKLPVKGGDRAALARL